MTADNITAELARLNELDVVEMASHLSAKAVINNHYPDTAQHQAIALANKLHALLVQAERAFARIYESLEVDEMGNIAVDALTAIRDAGIGGE